MPSMRPRAGFRGAPTAASWERATVVGTWDGRAVHVWGWDGEHTLPVDWHYRSFNRAPWPDTPLRAGALASVEVRLPDGSTMRPTSTRLDGVAGPAWLRRIADSPAPSDSMTWFRAVSRLALATVAAGRVTPTVAEAHGHLEARWRVVADDVVDDTLADLAAARPPICGGLVDDDALAMTTDVFAAFVDATARAELAAQGWRPPPAPRATPSASAIRSVFIALARPEPVLNKLGAAASTELGWLAAQLDDHARRIRGEPVVAPRVRLVVPDDPLDDWRAVLEVVDAADPGRWCTAEDLWDATPLAGELAGRHLDLVAGVALEAARTAGATVSVLSDWAHEHEPTAVEFDVEAAETFMEQAPAALADAGIELIGPERLVKAAVEVRGQARPAPANERQAGLGREALVEWKLTAIDGDGPTAITDAELARAEELGTTLLHSGRRWVRIDPAALRRARARADVRRRTAERVDAITLLRLAAEADEDELTAAPGVTGSDGAAPTAGWVESLLDGLPDEALREEVEPATFIGELRPYQRRGLAWMRFLDRLGLGGCLADDMGLGKTATTLAHLLERPGPHLVVCPLSVVHNWQAEANRFAPKLRVVIHHGAGRAGRRQAEDPQGALDGFDERADEDLADADLVVTTYGLLARDVDHLADVGWTTVVLDEAQMIKNPVTHAARAVRRLPAAQKLALTGTPVENRLSELWAILDAVNPGMLGSRERFRQRFARPIEREGDEEATAMLRRLTQPFVLRRTKADRSLVPDLPDKIEQIAWAGLTKEQAVLYQRVVDELLVNAANSAGMKRRGLVLAALTRLKQICNHPVHVLGDGSRLAGRSGKLARFDELVDELLDVGERALVFTQFREMGDLLQRHVRERLGLAAPFLHGGVARPRRDAMVADFQAGLGPPLLLVSLKAGGTGLNLTAASQVIHYDRWWNPAVEDQATDRAWRIGQGRTVLVHKLVCEGTVEERIATLIDEKRALADAVVGSGEAWLSELSTAELRDLVRLDAGAGDRP